MSNSRKIVKGKFFAGDTVFLHSLFFNITMIKTLSHPLHRIDENSKARFPSIKYHKTCREKHTVNNYGIGVRFNKNN